MATKAERQAIRRYYRPLRAALDLTQADVGALARRHYPEFGIRRYEAIENGLDFPTPSERKALAKALRVNEADLPTAEHLEKAS